jgi:hypothetical protein
MESPGERRVDVLAQVTGQDDQAVVFLEALEQVAHLGVGVAVGAMPDLGPLAEQGVGLVEEEHRAGAVD